MNIIDRVVDCIIEECKKRDIEDLTNMKMQKILYYIWVWYGVLYKKSIFNEEPQAWKYGPVFHSVYRNLSHKGSIPMTEDDIRHGCDSLEENIVSFIGNVLDKYGVFSAYQLKERSHKSVWKDSYLNTMDNTIHLNRAISYYEQNFKDAVDIEYDEEAEVWVATSSIIPGLVLESENYKQLLSDIEENSKLLIEENCG